MLQNLPKNIFVHIHFPNMYGLSKNGMCMWSLICGDYDASHSVFVISDNETTNFVSQIREEKTSLEY